MIDVSFLRISIFNRAWVRMGMFKFIDILFEKYEFDVVFNIHKWGNHIGFFVDLFR